MYCCYRDSTSAVVEELEVSAPSFREESLPPSVFNRWIETIWPEISNAVTEFICQVLEPEIQAAFQKHSKMSGMLSNFYFDKDHCHLGTKPLMFSSMKTTRTIQESRSGPMENMVMQALATWDGDCSISLRLGGVRLGLKSIVVRGLVTVEFVGLRHAWPPCQGIRMFFESMPDVSLALDGMLSPLGFVTHTIMKQVKRALAHEMVLPNMFAATIDKHEDIFKLKYPAPEALMWVTVLRAEELTPKHRHHLIGRYTADPFFEIHCGALHFISKVQHNTLSPSWNETAPLIISSSAHQRLCIEVFDDEVIKHELLGSVILSINDMSCWGDEEQCLNLSDKDGNSGSCGRIWLKATWVRLLGLGKQIVGEPVPPAAALVFAGIYSISKLPRRKHGTRYGVQVCCSGLGPELEFLNGSGVRETQMNKIPHIFKADKEAESRLVRQKLELMQKLKLKTEDMATLLDADPGELEKHLLGDDSSDVVELSVATIQFDTGFYFCITDIQQSKVTMELRCESPSPPAAAHPSPVKATPVQHIVKSTPVQHIVSTKEFAVENLLRCKDFILVEAAQLPGTSIILKVRLQLLYFGRPEAMPTSSRGNAVSFRRSKEANF